MNHWIGLRVNLQEITIPLNPANEAPEYAKIRASCMRKRDLLPSMTKLHLHRNAPSQHAQKAKNKRVFDTKRTAPWYTQCYMIYC